MVSLVCAIPFTGREFHPVILSYEPGGGRGDLDADRVDIFTSRGRVRAVLPF